MNQEGREDDSGSAARSPCFILDDVDDPELRIQ